MKLFFLTLVLYQAPLVFCESQFFPSKPISNFNKLNYFPKYDSRSLRFAGVEDPFRVPQFINPGFVSTQRPPVFFYRPPLRDNRPISFGFNPFPLKNQVFSGSTQAPPFIRPRSLPKKQSRFSTSISTTASPFYVHKDKPSPYNFIPRTEKKATLPVSNYSHTKIRSTPKPREFPRKKLPKKNKFNRKFGKSKFYSKKDSKNYFNLNFGKTKISYNSNSNKKTKGDIDFDYEDVVFKPFFPKKPKYKTTTTTTPRPLFKFSPKNDYFFSTPYIKPKSTTSRPFKVTPAVGSPTSRAFSETGNFFPKTSERTAPKFPQLISSTEFPLDIYKAVPEPKIQDNDVYYPISNFARIPAVPIQPQHQDDEGDEKYKMLLDRKRKLEIMRSKIV